ncbi:conserved hypothetical protein [Ricinus communis]|uniref:HMG box domain-containing protein n=1 Tax=Ricinus communis TaxID=3988 RepID=B9RA23_RICCO|nr:conserved hypothetical protein [Ricinus communis]
MAIQVEGDTGTLQFPVQFNIHNKNNHTHVPGNHFNLMRADSFENNLTLESTNPSSFYLTPNNTHEVEAEDQNALAEAGQLAIENNETGEWNRNLLETVLRRHSLPARPCSSYALFVMSNWVSVKNSSFGEASKSLGRIWGQLSLQEKKVFIGHGLEGQCKV